MSANTTIARPYAKAIFELALDNKQLQQWSIWLNMLGEYIQNEDVHSFFHNPVTTGVEHADVLISLVEKTFAGSIDANGKRLIQLLATNTRLDVMPSIAVQFDCMRANEEKTLVVQVTSFSALNQQQEERLVDALSRRLDRRVSLDVTIDESLLGGAIIRANDLVIDGSVRGKLTTLGAELAA